MNKLKAFAFIWMAMLSYDYQAQTISDKVNIGFSVNQFQKDFGIGLDVISPYFFNSTVAIRAGANFQWFEHPDGLGFETTWTPYQNIRLGVRGKNTVLADKIFVYGEGGCIAILPNSEFSSESVELGGYGLFGFEFIFDNIFSYYIEMGGVGAGAQADKILGNPIYSNGFLVSVGFKVGI